MSKQTARKDDRPDALLAQFFRQSGYIRRPDVERREQLGYTRYKKGYEVRLVVRTQRELAQVRRLVRQAGFAPGKPFQKHHQLVQPVYGKAAVDYFLTLLRQRT